MTDKTNKKYKAKMKHPPLMNHKHWFGIDHVVKGIDTYVVCVSEQESATLTKERWERLKVSDKNAEFVPVEEEAQMNAQEAIERVEWTIEQHKQMQMLFADKADPKQVGRYESLEKDIKALSIVLESAKLLHDISDVTPVYGGELRLHSLEMEDYYLDEKTAKTIGIDYGNDKEWLNH